MSERDVTIDRRVCIPPLRAVDLIIGMTSTKTLNAAFDFVLYPLAIYQFGAYYGGSIMAAVDILICLVAILIYDRTKRDWLGIEYLKGLTHYRGPRRSLRVTGNVLKRNKLLVFLFLSVKFDAFITTLYLRHGTFNGMSRRDWTILLLSILIGNLYWISACYVGLSLLEDCWIPRWVTGSLH